MRDCKFGTVPSEVHTTISNNTKHTLLCVVDITTIVAAVLLTRDKKRYYIVSSHVYTVIRYAQKMRNHVIRDHTWWSERFLNASNIWIPYSV
jgi:hypothetical protein